MSRHRPRADNRRRPRRVQRKIDARMGYRRYVDGEAALEEVLESMVSALETLSDRLPKAFEALVKAMDDMVQEAFSKVIAERRAAEVAAVTGMTTAEAIEVAQPLAQATGSTLADALVFLRDQAVRGGGTN